MALVQNPDGTWRNTLPSGTDAQGRQFFTQSDGSKFYYAPQANAAGTPNDSFLHNQVWNTKTGQWEKKTNWNNVAVLGAGALIAAPAAAAALGAGGGAAAGGVGASAAGGAAAGSAAAGGTVAGMSAGTAGLVGTGVNAGAQVYSAKKQSSAAKQANELQVQAANHAADVQAKSAADALAFQRQQAAQDLATANSTQKANYDQWAAREGRLGALGQFVGGSAAGPRNIPAYVPIPNAGPAAPVAAPAAPQPAPAAPQSPITSMSVLTGGNTGFAGNAAEVARSRGLPYMPGISGPSTGDPNRLVMMKAPTGQTKMVPAMTVPHYQSLGATVIG